MSETVTTKDAAQACETTPRLLRQFLRASNDYQAVGSGGRYSFKPTELAALKKRFSTWLTEREAAAKAREEAEKATATDEPEPVADEVKTEPAKPAPRGRKAAA
jgi:hypothetical protein